MGGSIDQCPGCGAESIKTETATPGGVCQGCGLVHNGDGWASNPATDANPDEYNDDEPRDTKKGSWREEIAIQDASDEQIVTILLKTDTAADELGLSDEERERAVELVIEAWEENLMHGRELEATVAAGVYLACRASGRPRPSTIVASVAETDASRLQDVRRVMVSELGIDIEASPPSTYVMYMSDQLDVPDSVAKRAREALEKAGTLGGNPAGIAAAALYLFSDRASDNLTLKEAGEAAGVTKETVWRKSRELDF